MNFRKFVYSVRNLTFPCPDDNLYTRKLGNGGKKNNLREKNWEETRNLCSGLIFKQRTISAEGRALLF